MVWLGFFDLSKLFQKYRTCRSFSVLKILSLYYFPSKFPSVPYKGITQAALELRARNVCVIFINNWIYCPPKLFKLAFDSWRVCYAKLMLCFHCRFSNLSCSAEHSRTNFFKLDRWNKHSLKRKNFKFRGNRSIFVRTEKQFA